MTARKNGFDWRLVAAVVYQDSHVLNSVRQNTGG
jgi:membrane-bound lytic murein transglycosylase MltF